MPVELGIEQWQRFDGDDWWNWAVWIEGPAPDLDKVEFVEWRLHPTFPDPIRKISDRKVNFRLKAGGWGEFRIIALVQFSDGSQRTLHHDLRLNRPGGALASPMGVKALTGFSNRPLTEAELEALGSASQTVMSRSRLLTTLAVDSSVDNANDLTQTGWAVLFASGIDPEIKKQLTPLLELRQKQVNDNNLFKIFEGPRGVQLNQDAESWSVQRQVGLSAPVDPSAGVPYHLLIVGSPEEIPFEFQALLDLQWSVGRLHFDRVEDYGRYAKAVVDYEAAEFAPTQSKSVSAWITRNRLDVATAMLSGAVVDNFTNANRSLGARQGFKLDIFNGEQATKEQLEKVLRGKAPNGPPAILFTGSHGAEWPLTDPELQKRLQGALVTQEWSEGQPLGTNNQFSADDVPNDAKLHGMIAFMFACFGGGCPSQDNYYLNEDGAPIDIAPRPFISSLAKTMLARGTLAVIAHVDRAFTYIFQDAFQTPQVQSLRTPVDRLLNGDRAGLAVDSLNLQWSVLAAQLATKQGPGSAPTKAALCDTLRIARDDARNYVVLGDPAARLRIDRLH